MATAKNTNKTKKVTAKKAVKFTRDSVEGTAIRTIKGRQKKIETAGTTLVSLWYEQGKELLELQAILECSQRQLEVHTGVKRSAINTYINIAQDPRLGEKDVVKQLGNFTQKDLIKLGKLDEDEFNEAVESGKLPKAEVVEAETSPEGKQPKVEAKWATELKGLIDDANGNYEKAKEAIEAYFAMDVEAEVVEEEELSPEVIALNEALDKIGTDDIEEQASTLGIKKGVLKTAINDGVMSKATIKKVYAYLES